MNAKKKQRQKLQINFSVIKNRRRERGERRENIHGNLWWRNLTKCGMLQRRMFSLTTPRFIVVMFKVAIG
ncbi:hypothetical protein ISN45_Aa08g029660 [Arabidopsis thaliana x Arabidopsis arenosa]|uniref:Uncharacterized protein n=1 Tax=Arabidopsis thaliana x Arabidopsis arenosa TaxID=1240361 RepID=A0A8T1XSL7_9BRAS|nr:hypothetical protein ISN45_Aa08g029660 [Arabidopsis thaliana x Arabidopsis arenosa]